MRELKRLFPDDHLKYDIVYDTTPFIHESVNEVVNTLISAVVLVAMVVLLFLQDWKAVMLPLIDVGVSLVGTFAVMKLLGFTLNNLTLFGLVLAIGIVVDDAIVVLENIERWLAKGLTSGTRPSRRWTRSPGPSSPSPSCSVACFCPVPFSAASRGQFFRQFALTIAASMIISAINAMTMTPARAAAIFKGRKHGVHGHDDGREALPWWIFAIIGGVVSLWLLWPFVALQFGLAEGQESTLGESGSLKVLVATYGLYAALFAPGALLGGIIGWIIIRPVNWLMAEFFKAFNYVFDITTHIYGRMVAWSLRLCVDRSARLRRAARSHLLRLYQCAGRLHPQPG